MFKLESYITPLILSRVEKYVKNVRNEDSQVSLWGGDVSLTNLDLRLDVLEEEFKLPFRLVSGHIHELQIHVPWTRLQSEPIVLTINTIECVLKLPDDNNQDEVRSGSASEESATSQDSVRKLRRSRGGEEAGGAAASPPGYVQNLVAKILSNVQIVCNNLILKYVEDDLVLSINVRRASLVSVDGKWEPAFTELSLPDLTLRKLLTVSDLTVCLDRRGPLGKIQVYEDPILYRCYLSVRISWLYRSLLNKTAYRTLFHLHADKLEFSITNKQIALLYRLYQMLQVVSARRVPHGDGNVEGHDDPLGDEAQEHADQLDDADGYTLGGILWTVGSTVGSALLPVTWDDEDEQETETEHQADLHKLTEDISTSIAFAIKDITFTLKTSRSVKSKGLYGGLRNIVNPFMNVSVQGVTLRLSSLGHDWVNVQGGLSQIICTPAQDQHQLSSGSSPPHGTPYLLVGCESDNYLKDSLFESSADDENMNAVETRYNKVKNWDLHMERLTESVLLERCPALAVDYLYQAEFPSEATPEDIVKMNMNMEHSNVPERALGRVVVGPSSLNIDTTFMDKFLILQEALDDISAPTDSPHTESHKLEIPTKEEIENLENNNPTKIFSLTFVHPVVNIVNDKLRFECGLRNLVVSQRSPMYPLRNVKVGSMMHPPSRIILNNCHSSITLVAAELWSRLHHECQTTTQLHHLATVDRIKLVYRTLLFQEHWKNIYQKHGEFTADVDEAEVRVSSNSLRMVRNVYNSVIKRKVEVLPAPGGDGSSEDGEGGQEIVASVSKLSTTFTWTSKIHTLGISVGPTTMKYGISPSLPHKPKYFVFFKGFPYPHKSNEKMESKELGDWFHALLQYPAGDDVQFVPPILFFRLGHTDTMLFANVIPLLLDISQGLNPTSSDGNASLKVDDSGFKSANESFSQKSESKHQEKTKMSTSLSDINPGLYRKPNTKDIYADLIRSSIVNVKTERFNIYFVENLSFSFTSESVSESLSKISSLKPWLGMVRVGVPLVQCHNSSLEVGVDSLAQYPVLFPSTVWIAGKNMLPLALNMNNFEIDLLENHKILLPVSFRCTLSLNRLQKLSYTSFVLHTDFSPLELVLDDECVGGVCATLETLLSVCRAMFSCSSSSAQDTEVVLIKPSASSSNVIHHSVSSLSEYGGISATVSQDTQDNRNNDNARAGPTGVSIWLQFTIPSLTYRMIGRNTTAVRRLSIFMEDTSVSLDSQASYTKISLRMRKMSSLSEVQDSAGEWREGEQQMLMISCNKDLFPDLGTWINEQNKSEEVAERNEDIEASGTSTPQSLTTGFFNVIFTSAQVKNVHRKLKLTGSDQAFGSKDQQQQPNRYLSEIDIEVHPLDVFVSIECIKMVTHALMPFLNLMARSVSKTEEQTDKVSSTHNSLAQLNNNTLPLIYIKAKSSRLFLLNNSEENETKSDRTNYQPDLFIIEMESANMTSQVDNPISRVIVDHKLYYKSAEAASLEVPGSSVEDRQYQLNIQSFSVYTATWKDLMREQPKPEKILLRTMSENPAFEWNIRSNSDQNVQGKLAPRILAIVSGINSKLNFAPAIVWRKFGENRMEDHLVAGASVEWNTLSDIILCLSTNQISAVTSILRALQHFDTAADPETLTTPPSDVENESFKFEVPLEVLLTCRSFKFILYEDAGVSDDDTGGVSEHKPYVEMLIDQPHMFSTLGPSVQEVSLSLYTLHFALPDQDDLHGVDSKQLVTSASFPKIVLGCGEGDPHPVSGIRPPLLTVKGSSVLTSAPSVQVKLARQVTCHLDTQVESQIVQILNTLHTLSTPDAGYSSNTKNNPETNKTAIQSCNFELETQPVKLSYDYKDVGVDVQVHSIVLKGELNKSSNPAPVSNPLHVKSKLEFNKIKSQLRSPSQNFSLLYPVNIGVEMNLTLDNRVKFPLNGYLRCNLGRFVINLGPEHVKLMNKIAQRFQQESESSYSVEREKSPIKQCFVRDESNDGEHFNDDLRVGTFSVSESVGTDLPTPYRVVYSSSSICWTYPRPRTLTKLSVLPLPLTCATTSAAEPEARVDCQLHYWSVHRSAWRHYATFQLEESNVTHVDLPLYTDKRRCEFACTWRIEMVAGSGSILPEVPCSLLSAVRVDSFYSSTLQPQLQVILDADVLKLNLYNHLHNNNNLDMHPDFCGLTLQPMLPLEQNFLTASLHSASTELSVWSDEKSQDKDKASTIKLVSRGRLQVDITDYCYLATHQVLSTGEMSLRVQREEDFVDVFIASPFMDLNFGPFSLHTLRQSSRIWNQVSSGESNGFVPLTQMMIVNESNTYLHIGQAGTDQCLQIGPRTAIMYTWRSHLARSVLKVATSAAPIQWSEPFSVDGGETTIKLPGESMLIVSVEKKSSTHRIITLKGVVTIVNLLKDHLELRVSQGGQEISKQICGSQERPLNFIASGQSPVELKAKYFGPSADWTSPISLHSLSEPFLLKLLNKEKEFTPVWLQVFTEDSPLGYTRTLAVFAPMYLMESCVPGTMFASIHTKMRTTDIALAGFQPATQINLTQKGSETSFEVSFKLSSDGPSSSPAVPVSESIIDNIRPTSQQTLPLDQIQDEIMKLVKSELGSDSSSDLSSLKVMQSATDCKVNFDTLHGLLNTLVVKIEPKFLVINQLNIPVMMQVGESTYNMDQNSVLNSDFSSKHIRFGLASSDGQVKYGCNVEMLDHDWTYVSLLPSSADNTHLSLTGSTVYQIQCAGFTCFMLISSEGSEEATTRKIYIKPYFLLTDLLTLHPFKTRTGVIRRQNLVIEYDDDDKDECYQTEKIVSGSCLQHMLMWKQLDKGDGKPECVISFSADDSDCGSLWSQNLTVKSDQDTRQCFVMRRGGREATPCLLLTQKLDDQVHISISKDERPQMKLVNKLNKSVQFKEPGGTAECTLEAGGLTWFTCSYLQNGFPYVVEKKEKTLLQFTADKAGGWSDTMNVGFTQESFLCVPGLGDIKLNIQTSLPTILIILEPVSNKEISAKDIRARFDSISTEDNVLFEQDEKSDKDRISRETSPELSISYHRSIFTISANIEKINLGVSDDLCNFVNIQEILRLTMFGVDLKMLPELSSMHNLDNRLATSQEYVVKFSLDNMQLDNQMYDVGLYRFPVVFSKHDHSDSKFLDLTMKLSRFEEKTYLDDIDVGLGKFCVYIEDTLVYVLQDIGKQYLNIGTEVTENKPSDSELNVLLPLRIQAESSSNPFFLNKIQIREISLQVTVYASIKVHLGLEETLLNLSRYEASQLWCTGFSLGHTMSRHYLSGALFKAGWVIGSLDVIGNPAAFTRSVREGIKDFVALPFEGILRGPWGFLVGLTQGSSSLVKHVSAGTITSVTNFAQSVSRNLDKLSQDSEHWARNEEARRLKPRGVSEGVLYGLSSVGVGVLGALGGLAHHPLQVLMTEGMSPAKLAASLGKGLIGMVAKPLGGAAELIALTGQGLLASSGWCKERYQVRSSIPNLIVDLKSSVLKHESNFCKDGSQVLFSCEASLYLEETRQYVPVTCLITQTKFILINEYEDSVYQTHNISDVAVQPSKDDPTLTVVMILKEDQAGAEVRSHQTKDRVAQFILDTIQYTENHGKRQDTPESGCTDGSSLVPVHRPPAPLQPAVQVEAEYLLYMNPQYLAWFHLMLDCAQVP